MTEFLSAASANGDTDVYDALTFDITRGRPSHLTFGGGPQHCLGANLTRAEMEEAFRVLPVRLRNLRLDGEPTCRAETVISGPSSLPLAFDPD